LRSFNDPSWSIAINIQAQLASTFVAAHPNIIATIRHWLNCINCLRNSGEFPSLIRVTVINRLDEFKIIFSKRCSDIEIRTVVFNGKLFITFLLVAKIKELDSPTLVSSSMIEILDQWRPLLLWIFRYIDNQVWELWFKNW